MPNVGMITQVGIEKSNRSTDDKRFQVGVAGETKT